MNTITSMLCTASLLAAAALSSPARAESCTFSWIPPGPGLCQAHKICDDGTYMPGRAHIPYSGSAEDCEKLANEECPSISCGSQGGGKRGDSTELSL